MIKIISRKAIFILAVIIMGGLGGVIVDRYLFPYLSSTELFSKYAFLKKSTEEVTIINKTEQVFVKEETSIAKISNQASSAVVGVVSYPDPEDQTAAAKSMKPKYGAGVIVTSDGLIMTYADALNLTSSKYKVILSNNNAYDAEFSGNDSYSNLVFLKINASNLPAASFGNSDDIKPGEKIIAIGVSPENFEHEYASGLVSNFNQTYNLAGKSLSSSDKLEGVFESDLVVGADYIGGPIVDYTGQVVGIIGKNEGSDKVNYFQIPANKVGRVIDRAIKKETDNDPSLGIYYVPLTRGYAMVNDAGSEKGALIFSASGQSGLAIMANYPAQKAGLQLNDIIIRINDQEITPDNALSDVLYRFKKGDSIELTVLRGGQEMKIQVQL